MSWKLEFFQTFDVKALLFHFWTQHTVNKKSKKVGRIKQMKYSKNN